MKIHYHISRNWINRVWCRRVLFYHGDKRVLWIGYFSGMPRHWPRFAWFPDRRTLDSGRLCIYWGPDFRQ